MISLKFKNTPTKSFEIPEVWVKSVSAAWNQIREWRDTLPFEVLEGAIIEVRDGDELINSTRIPSQILFKANKNGKLEFKDFTKIKVIDKKLKKEEEHLVPAASKKIPNNFALVTTRGQVDMKKIFNPLF